MAVQNLTNLYAFVGGYNLACRAKSMEVPTVSVEALDATAMCDTWTKVIAGNKTASWTASVMQDFAADEVDALLGLDNAAFGGTAGQPISVAPAGITGGEVAYAFNASTFSYTPMQASAGEIAMATLSGSGTGSPVVRGTLMDDPTAAVTTTGTGTARQLGAVTTGQRMYAALHVLSASGGTPTLDVVIQSDDNSGMSSATSRITFTQATDITSQWSSVAGAITDDYWRVSYTIGGSTPSFTFAVVLGIATP